MALVATFAIVALLGVATGVLLAYSPDLPEIEALDDYAPGTITRVHARNGELIGEFATQRRVIIGYDDIPDVLRNAIVAAEDGEFFEHIGVNIPRILITLVNNILSGDLRAAGARTRDGHTQGWTVDPGERIQKPRRRRPAPHGTTTMSQQKTNVCTPAAGSPIGH